MTVKLSIILNRLCRQIIEDFSLIKQSGMLSKGTNTFPLPRKQKKWHDDNTTV